MEHDERIPGVTFRLTHGSKKPPIDPKLHKAVGHVELYAEINDFNVWDEVLQRLNGMRVYTVENLAEEMINVAQKKAREAETNLSKRIQQLEAELEQSKQRESFAAAEIQQLHGIIIEQNRELAGLRALESELKALEGELNEPMFTGPLRNKSDPR